MLFVGKFLFIWDFWKGSKEVDEIASSLFLSHFLFASPKRAKAK